MTLGRISLNQPILPPCNRLRQFSDEPRVVEANCGKSKPVAACLNISLEEEARVSSPSKSGSDKGKEVMGWESKVLVGTYARAPLVLESGRGCKLYDVDGKEYLDLSSGIALNSLGHGDPDWVGAVVEQATKLLVANSFADRVFFCNSGTEANEPAIKFARKFQRHSHPDAKKPATDFLSFSNSFHGRTMGALALTSKEHYRIPFEPVMPGVTFGGMAGNIEATRKEIIRGKTAAVFDKLSWF